MKTPEELNALKEDVETLNKKRAGITEEELKQVSGGTNQSQLYEFKAGEKIDLMIETPRYTDLYVVIKESITTSNPDERIAVIVHRRNNHPTVEITFEAIYKAIDLYNARGH